METCSMCKKEVEVLRHSIPGGKQICPECAKRIKELLSSNEPDIVRPAVNYIYTCAKAATDKDVSDYLNSLLENNASDIEKSVQTKEKESPVNLNEQADYFEDKKKEEDSGAGFGGSFMKVVAWMLWIGGFILSIAMSLTSEYRSTTFNWTLFFTAFSIYFFAGSFAMCLSELFKNVNTIKNEICKMNKKNK